MRQTASCTALTSPPLRGSSPRLRGLENRRGENNCFLNVTLQAFWNLRSFRTLCQSSPEHQHPAVPSCPSLTASSYSSGSASESSSSLPASPTWACHAPGEAPEAPSAAAGERRRRSLTLPPVFPLSASPSAADAHERAEAEPDGATSQAPQGEESPFLASFTSPSKQQEETPNDASWNARRGRQKNASTDGGRGTPVRVSPDRLSASFASCSASSPPAEDESGTRKALQPSRAALSQLPAAASCVYCAIKNLFANYQFGSCEVLPAAPIRASLASCWASTRFMPGDMEDADETLVGVLDALHAWHQGLSTPAPSAYPFSSVPWSAASHASDSSQDLSNPLNFLEFYREVPCNPPCLAHSLFSLHLLFLPRCTACGATGEPLLQQLYVHRAYVAELLPVLASKSPHSLLPCLSPSRSASSAKPSRFRSRSTRVRASREASRGRSERGSSCSPDDASARESGSVLSASSRGASGSKPWLPRFLTEPESASAPSLSVNKRQETGLSLGQPSPVSDDARSPRAGASAKNGFGGSRGLRLGACASLLGEALRALFLADATLANPENLRIPRLSAAVAGRAQAERRLAACAFLSVGDQLLPAACAEADAYPGEAGGLSSSRRLEDDTEERAGEEQLRRGLSRVAQLGSSDYSDPLDEDFKRLQQLFQFADRVRLSPQRKAQKKHVASRGRAPSQRDRRGDVVREEAAEDARGPRPDSATKRTGKGDCEQCSGAATVVLDRYCIHAPAVFVCSLTWPPDLAQIAPSSPLDASPSASSPFFGLPSLKGGAQKDREEARQSIFLLLQSLAPVLDVRQVSIFSSETGRASSPAGRRRTHSSGDASGEAARDRTARHSGDASPSISRDWRANDPESTAREEVEAFTADVDGKHVFRGMVSFYGRHYVCFFHHWGSGKWVLFNDSRVTRGLTWTDVVSMCVSGKLLPCLLFFERISFAAVSRWDLRPSFFPPPSSSFSSCASSASSAFSSSSSGSFSASEVPAAGLRRAPPDGDRPEAPAAARRKEEYGKEALQIFCAEMLSCQALSFEAFALKDLQGASPGFRVLDDTASGSATPCRMS
ncbi:hypothetical protein BESB_004800 [Besnoitia besnoiti]|uniref:Peptidase C19 ubiquitin carboxyl-terminal hydrolase domain-containing protein n=1 Tax=Besnoitia besnoiti TaxID=94643 RepID=A0A2A9MJP9_BESBE|nr:hypothetical protein BESB_004800 [Besnoitia besnoiti]PFH38139.1 hypothetical protein BESB_004800 [Besnoitia besnoiti]